MSGLDAFDALAGAATGLADTVGTYLKDLNLDFRLNLDTGQVNLLSDVLGGAVTGAAISYISGGDVGKAALYGGLGAGISSNYGDGILGGYGNELGGAIQGYGVGGVSGALGGGLAAAYSDYSKGGGAKNDYVTNLKNSGLPVEDTLGGSGGDGGTSLNASLADKLKEYGLMKADGDGTLLGKGLLLGASGMAAQANKEDNMKAETEYAKEAYQERTRIDDEAQQNRIAAFSGSQPTFRIQRNG